MQTRMFQRLVCALWMFLLVVGAMACAGSSKYMKEVRSREPITAPADKATVVFLRPSGMAFAINFAILDQQGNWVGDAVSQSHFAVTLRPGEYMFIGWAENTAALKATLAPGRVYYVEVTPSMGFGSAHVALEALTPQHEDWKELRKWLRETKQLEPLESGTAYIESRRDDAMKRVASAKENWEGYSAAEKAQRTLRAQDGEASEGAPAATADSRAGAACAKDTECPGDQVCEKGRCSGGQKTGGGAAVSCAKDTECPGDQVCDKGVCKGTAPGGSAVTAPATATQPAATKCTKDSDCPGNQLCLRLVCTAPTSSAPTASATPPVAAAPATKCAKNADCTSDQFCSKGQCVPVPGSSPSSIACKNTSECPAETICKKARCVAPDSK